MAKFEVYPAQNGEFYFRLKASNGQVILTSEGYKQKTSALNGIDSVKKNSEDETKFEKKTASNGKFHFSLKATNGQIIGSSQMYTTEDSRDNGIDSVQKNAPAAEVLEVTE